MPWNCRIADADRPGSRCLRLLPSRGHGNKGSDDSKGGCLRCPTQQNLAKPCLAFWSTYSVLGGSPKAPLPMRILSWRLSFLGSLTTDALFLKGNCCIPPSHRCWWWFGKKVGPNGGSSIMSSFRVMSHQKDSTITIHIYIYVYKCIWIHVD